jgi:hypothetical protein
MDAHTVYQILAVIILIIGIALALFGRAIWAGLLTAIGSMIGWMLGFAIGAMFFGFDSITGIIITLVLAFLGSFILGTVFRFLVELALALLTGLLCGALVYFFTGNIIIAVIVFAVGLILAYVFIEKVVVVVTALIGSLLAAAATYYLLDRNENYAVLAFIGLFIGGILIQHFLLEEYDTIQYGN